MMAVRVLAGDSRRWREKRLDLSNLTVTVGTEVIPQGRILMIAIRVLGVVTTFFMAN